MTKFLFEIFTGVNISRSPGDSSAASSLSPRWLNTSNTNRNRSARYVTGRHAPPKGWNCHVLASYQIWFAKIVKKMPKVSKIVKIWGFFWRAKSGIASKVTMIVTFDAIPDLALHKNHQIFTILLTFGIFFNNFGKPHLVARQNMTFWPVGKNMSEHNISNTQFVLTFGCFNFFRFFRSESCTQSTSAKW